MATLDYAAIANAATLALEIAGTTATLIQKSKTEASSEDAPEYDETQTTIKMVDDELREFDNERQITRTRRVFYIEPNAAQPKQDDVVLYGGQRHQLYEVKPIAPAGTAVLYIGYLEK